MTRGRKKDHTIPESRALAVQRSYRDRKAKYVADLEERCASAEAEVVRLREELAEARRMQGSASLLATHEAHELVRNDQLDSHESDEADTCAHVPIVARVLGDVGASFLDTTGAGSLSGSFNERRAR